MLQTREKEKKIKVQAAGVEKTNANEFIKKGIRKLIWTNRITTAQEI